MHPLGGDQSKGKEKSGQLRLNEMKPHVLQSTKPKIQFHITSNATLYLQRLIIRPPLSPFVFLKQHLLLQDALFTQHIFHHILQQ